MTTPDSNAYAPAVPAEAGHVLVVIDHREASIYRSAHPGSVPQQVRPHLPAYVPRAAEPSDPIGFFEPVAGILNGARKILIFSLGAAAGGDLDRFTAWLTHHRPELAARVIGAQALAEDDPAEGRMLAKAREIYAGLPGSSA